MPKPQMGRHKRDGNPLYGVWRSMCHRCTSTKNVAYPRYGGAGITVCSEWLNSFDTFADWAIANGWGKGLHIDKDIKSKELGIVPPVYSPSTCTVVTPRINNLHSSATKLSDEVVDAIVSMFDAHEDTFEHRQNVCKKFNLTKKQLGCTLARRANKQLGRGKSSVLTSTVRTQLLDLRSQGLPFKDIANQLNINYHTCKSWHGKYTREMGNEL